MARAWTKNVDCSNCKSKLKLSEFQFYAKEGSYKGGYSYDTLFRCTKCGKQNCFNGLPKRITARLIKRAEQEEED